MIDRPPAATFEEERRGAGRYLDAIREHWLLIVGLVIVAVTAAAAYSYTAAKRYEAEAQIVITPTTDATLLSIGLFGESSGQSRAVLTAARLIKTPEIAEALRLRIRPTAGRTQLLNSVVVTPLGQSQIVIIVGTAGSASRAVQIANGFAEVFVARRTAQMQRNLRAQLARLSAQLDAIANPQDPRAVPLGQQYGVLSGLVGASDPTVQIGSRAVEPGGPVWPKPKLAIAVALLAALLLGVGAALGYELASPRLTREEELLLGHRLPILARIPAMPRRLVQGYLMGQEPLPGDVREAYRTLRASLSGAGGERFPGVILVTSALPREGKTMTSVNLAVTLATAGMRVILVDGDLRRPMVATVFRVPPRPIGFANILAEQASVDEALVPAPGYGDNLQLLLASPEHVHLIDLLEPHRVERALAELRLFADVVIVDSPPLTEVADALTLADEADAVIVAVRIGRTRRDRLAELRRMLAQRGVIPAGFVVTTRRRPRGTGYYYGDDERQDTQRRSRRAPIRLP